MSLKRSFIPSAMRGEFPLNNIPLGIAFQRGTHRHFLCTRIGDSIIRLDVLEASGLLSLPEPAGHDVFAQRYLNSFISTGPQAWIAFRSTIQELFSEQSSFRDDGRLLNSIVAPGDVEMTMPVDVRAFTDFYSSKLHASNLGKILRGNDNPLQPNWLHMPVAYDARASSVVVSGTPVQRPSGQFRLDPDAPPLFAPTRKLDAELEIGTIIGVANDLGVPVPIKSALAHAFGFVLLNDWSARDIQSFEYQPLGPFLGKSFCTTISTWVIMQAALVDFRRPIGVQDPPPLPHLMVSPDYVFDIDLELSIKTPGLSDFTVLSRTNATNLYWTVAQQIAHHTSNGCNLQIGDLLGSGTISGPGDGQLGSFMEMSWNGTRDVHLNNGEVRRFLSDGDHVRLTGRCHGNDYSVGFGEAAGTVFTSDVR